MDFNKLKQKALEMKDKAVEMSKNAADKTVENFSKSGMILNNTKGKDKHQALEDFIKSKKRTVVVFGIEESTFFKDMLIRLPILYTKSFAQNFDIKIYAASKDEDLTKLKIESLPTLNIYKEGELSESVVGEENISKLVKNLSLDIENVVNK